MANRTRASTLMLLATLALGCGGAEATLDDDGTGGKPKKEKKEGAAQPEAKTRSAAAGSALAPLASRTFRDTDFVESEFNRDPFRSFVPEVKAGPKAIVTQRKVLMPNTPIGSVKLIAIVTGLAQPRAMLVDAKGVGYVASRGDFVGLAEVVQSGGSENLGVSLNWRVDRIRENEVVLAREDPTGPNRPPLTRVIPLHDAEEEQALALPNDG